MLLSPAEFDRVQEQESGRFMAAVNRGIKDADDGKVLNSAQAKSRLGIKKQIEIITVFEGHRQLNKNKLK